MNIKFIKEYVNASKGTIINVDDSNADRLIKGGYAEKTKENPKQVTEKLETEESEETNEVIENKCEGCGDTAEPCEDCKEEVKETKKNK